VSKIFLYRQRARRILAVGLGICLTLATIGPSVAFACEGGGEEPQHISIDPSQWNEGEGCPENAAKTKVVFTAVLQWCQYEVENNNAVEEVTIESIKLLFQPACEFGGGKVCLGFKVATEKECNAGVKLVAGGGKCFVKLEYLKKPAAESETTLSVETKSKPGNVKKVTDAHQIVK
jgi:hypothetical protein